MNCRPLDLAEIVGAGHDTFHLIGTKVVVIELRLFWSAGPCWSYDSLEGVRLRSITGREIQILEDCYLRPIRRRGDEEDEILRLVGKPGSKDRIEAMRHAMRRPRERA